MLFRRVVHKLHIRSFSTSPYYITTPIFYPNAVPHVGHLYSLVTGDIFARHARLSNRPTHFLIGTDEHGLKIQKAAQARGMHPKDFCDELSEQFRILAKKADISNTSFMRTTDKAHHESVQHIWRTLASKNLIHKQAYSGWYSITDESFYTPSQITSGSPPIATETSSPVEWAQEENYMLNLEPMRRALLEHYEQDGGRITPEMHHARIVDDLRSGPLAPLSISRPKERIGWGVEVPGDPSQTVYVWFDALIIYLTGAGYPAKGAWPPDLQIIGKDILRFHAIHLPAIVTALGLPLPRSLLAHAHWTSAQRKMSKSLGNVADPLHAIEVYGIDGVRWYLARVGGRFRDDVDWSEDQLAKHALELQSLLGNFFLRIISPKISSLAAEAATIRTPEQVIRSLLASPPTDDWSHVLHAARSLVLTVRSLLDACEVSQATDSVVHVLKLANAALTQTHPWSGPSEVAYTAQVVSLAVLRVCGVCLGPVVPGVAGRLLDALGMSRQQSWEEGVRAVDLQGVKGVRLFEGAKGKNKMAK